MDQPGAALLRLEKVVEAWAEKDEWDREHPKETNKA